MLHLLVCLSCCLNNLGRDQRKSSGFSFTWVTHGFAVKQDLSVSPRHQTSSDCRPGLGILRQGTTAGNVMLVNVLFLFGLPQPDTFQWPFVVLSWNFPDCVSRQSGGWRAQECHVSVTSRSGRATHDNNNLLNSDAGLG